MTGFLLCLSKAIHTLVQANLTVDGFFNCRNADVICVLLCLMNFTHRVMMPSSRKVR